VVSGRRRRSLRQRPAGGGLDGQVPRVPSDWAAILTTTAGALVLAATTMVMLVAEI